MNACLQLDEVLDQIIYDEGIGVEYTDLKRWNIAGLYSTCESMGDAVISLDTGEYTRNERNVVKAHELGHHYNDAGIDLFTAPRWVQQREEAKAIRWQTEFLFSPERLIAAFESAYVSTPLDMADYLEVTIQELHQGVERLENMYGPRLIHGQCVITWRPFKVSRDRRRKSL